MGIKDKLGKNRPLLDGLSTEAKQDEIISALNSSALTVTNAIGVVDFDLNASAFSETTNISNDFIFDRIELNFSTTESKTITITTSIGNVFYTSTNTEQNIKLPFGDSFNGGENLTVTVTQFSSAGTMDCTLVVREGVGESLTGSPSLGASDEIIGKVRPVDANGVDVTDKDYNAVKTLLQDQTTEPVELFLARLLNTTTLAVNGTLLSNALTLTAGHGAVAGDYIGLKEGNKFMQARILTVATNNIALDMPLDYAFTILSAVTITTKNMKVDGSSTPVVFRITPAGLTNVKYHIRRLRFNLVGTSALKGEDFASIVGGLTKGVMLRRKDGIYKNVGAVKSNGDFNVRADVEYEDKPLYSLRAVKSMYEDFGVVIELKSDDSDELQIVIQDNLNVAGVAEFNCIAQGHVSKD